MGKRKTARKPQKRLKQVLAKKFLCIYCSHDDTVTVKIDAKDKAGRLACSACGVAFETPVHSLAEPVDVYSTWIDAAEAKQREEDERKRAAARALDSVDDEDHDEYDDEHLPRDPRPGVTAYSDDEGADLPAVPRMRSRVASDDEDEEDVEGEEEQRSTAKRRRSPTPNDAEDLEEEVARPSKRADLDGLFGDTDDEQDDAEDE
ncbi:hypothetical protein HDU86_005706 [Geranomyces michiganensis]|nr:hypothetical protein HDU86_005706 [Geranomyces michiganensis]